jgi:isoamylase
MATIAPTIRIWEGNSTPLGATWDGLGVNFSLFSANATKVELCLFDQNGTQEIQRIELPEYTDEIWHGYLPDAARLTKGAANRGRALILSPLTTALR